MSLKDRIFNRITINEKSGCWDWPKPTRRKWGVGTINVGGTARSVTAVSYEVFIGPAPEGKRIFQSCGNKKCVNPEHLVAATNKLSSFRPSLLERFKSYCGAPTPRGCTEWTGSRLPVKGKEYGCFRVDGKTVRAHRVAYELFNGDIPFGMHVLHSCDNPPCVNPDHLYLGTNLDNVADKVKKLRHCFHERHPRAKLDGEKVLRIKEMFSSGKHSYSALAKMFSVGDDSIRDIISGRTWTKNLIK
jgi:hypothetical protein